MLGTRTKGYPLELRNWPTLLLTQNLYLSWLLGERPSGFSKFNFNMNALNSSRRRSGVRKVTVPVWVAGFTLSQNSAENLPSAAWGLTGTRFHPRLRRQELIQKMLNRGRRVFNASNINLLSISFNLFTLGRPFIFSKM
jgi:hypothetical protein